jgi:hypothetical protein
MSIRLQEKFCQTHKARTADDLWLDRGYPNIDWSALKSRFGAHHGHIHAVLNGDYTSPFYKQHAKMVSSIKNRSATSAAVSGRFTGLRAGYYGTKGEKIMYVLEDHNISLFMSNLNPGPRTSSKLSQTNFVLCPEQIRSWLLVVHQAVCQVMCTLSWYQNWL